MSLLHCQSAAARAISSGLLVICSKIVEFIIATICCVFNLCLRFIKGILIFFSPFVLAYLLMLRFFYFLPMPQLSLGSHVVNWFEIATQAKPADHIVNFDQLIVLPQSEIESLKSCTAVFIEDDDDDDTLKIQKLNNAVQTCGSMGYVCHGLGVNITNCAANNPTFLQDIIDIAEKPCKYSRWWLVDEALQCYRYADGVSLFLGEKTFSAINVFDEDSLRYQIIVPRLDNLRAKNKGKKDHKYYER